ncbi:5-dehydro-4-deoxy-D-glucuronate isomerase [Allostreptomyces psammosilenae]|uniref:4-deoxy-L-threo-5-hexosulose-uronate ketol-isomerase n=1 Tax=Allostreptomyces psammosilenae TaxID=1892865 RepID=A0A852ZXV5_9ACTN|nr:5-dehydro-4-deoxy-D-glucuronate isomerase [Allostreptomyces psammosilenae]NYI06607.1 4-deoxy-L-threo-5-hexosulose-uronate ketol-isomerase [Allostreptomyces psammosilenae]
MEGSNTRNTGDAAGGGHTAPGEHPGHTMEVRHATHPDQVPGLDTEDLRRHYLVENLFPTGRIRAVYTHTDRMVIAGTTPAPGEPVELGTFPPLRADHFLQRRELGVINLGGPGTVTADGTEHALDTKDCLYLGRGVREVAFATAQPPTGTPAGPPARFYLVSTPAHTTHPTRLARHRDSTGIRLGTADGANIRTLHRYIAADGIPSCQLVMGVTVLEPGSLWNTMPCHTHDRRTEIYLYTDLPDDHRVIHLMGRPDRTRHLVVAGDQAVIAPSWSVHTGAGTHAYAFVWAMGGENQAFDDMDHVTIPELR